MKGTEVACGHHHRVGPHAEDTTQGRSGIRGPKNGRQYEYAGVLQSGHFWQQEAEAITHASITILGAALPAAAAI